MVYCVNLKYPKNDRSHNPEYIWLAMSIVPLLESSQTEGPCSILVTFQDVTSMKESELTIREQERMLSVKGRFTALGEMASGIAHEINNPLAILNGRVAQIRRIITNNVHEKQINTILQGVLVFFDYIILIIFN